MLKLLVFATGVTLILVPALGAADDAPDAGAHHGPRPEAIAACKDKAEGDACEFDAPWGHVSGTCRRGHSGDLACRHPHPQQ